MGTIVDAWGEAAHCEQCNAATDESDLHTLANGDEVCGHCFGVLSELRTILSPAAPAALREEKDDG